MNKVSNESELNERFFYNTMDFVSRNYDSANRQEMEDALNSMFGVALLLMKKMRWSKDLEEAYFAFITRKYFETFKG